jgi:hypothetical protein
VFFVASFYNCIGVWIKIITIMKINRQTYFLRVVWASFIALLICGCVGKKPDDDVVLIKQLLAKFERGVNQGSQAVLDSITQDKKKNMASQLLDSLSIAGKLESARITSKMFVIVEDSAEVRLGLRLSSKYTKGEEKAEEIEKQLKLFLHKKRGKWKIRSFNMEPENEQ